MVDIPQLDLPFRFVGGREVVVEQDSVKDVTNCVEAIIRTVVGTREERPDFGIPDTTFSTQPLTTDDIAQKILADEPRAQTLIEQHPDVVNQMIARVRIEVSTREVPGA